MNFIVSKREKSTDRSCGCVLRAKTSIDILDHNHTSLFVKHTERGRKEKEKKKRERKGGLSEQITWITYIQIMFNRGTVRITIMLLLLLLLLL
ncbi:hypothetical protein PUN28_000041 [Cardiocondyla obscurior]|uniref:Uncharacterized protein n=1 Tax=Cardiocondyla obscurior TaxID=286306 RepID=A0AAW2GXR5_9HYME